MNYWITTDTHFDHDAMWQRFGRPKDFETKIIDNIGKNVNYNDDILIHLGDIAFGNADKWITVLSGYCKRMWLLKGNHDTNSYKWYLEAGFDVVAEVLELDYMGKRIAFSHMPIKDTGYDINIHGHFHDIGEKAWDFDGLRPIRNDKQHLIKLEHDYKPVSLKAILKDLP